jgi:hypothetical protein
MSTRPSATIARHRSRGRLGALVAAWCDIILAAAGTGCILAAVTVLAGWPWALLAGGVALIALALVVPEWD